MITALTINFNTPDLLETLLASFRRYYDIPFFVVDGSSPDEYEKILSFSDRFKIEIHHFNNNVHHGGGMAYGIKQIKTEQILLIDSDIRILRGGFLDDLQGKLRIGNYGIGDVSTIDRDGVSQLKGIKYLHPSFTLINREVALKYPLPIKHGAPMIDTMKYIHSRGLNILQHESWINNDLENSYFKKYQSCKYFIHLWNGTRAKIEGITLW